MRCLVDTRKLQRYYVSSGKSKKINNLIYIWYRYDLIESEDTNGCTPLFMAIRYNEIECLKLLISYDCNIGHKMYLYNSVSHKSFL